MNLLDINGSRLEVRRIAGPADLTPIVFLHEGLGSVSLWTQRGLDWPQAVCNATGRLQLNYVHREAWEVLPALLQELQIEKPVLLGHSDGATIALLHASRFPVSACIAMAPHVLVEDITVQSIARAEVAFESGELRKRLARHHANVDCAYWQWNDVWQSPAFRSFDIRPECRYIRAPLLLIQGLDDEYGTLLHLDEIALAAPHAQQLRLAACGHSPQRDQPEKTVEAVADFLKIVA